MSERRVAAASLLALSIIVSGATATRLGALGDVPSRATPYVVAFACAFGLAFLGGRLAPPEVERPVRAGSNGEELPRCRRPRRAALVVTLYALIATWILQSKPSPPGFLIGTWILAVVAIPFGFPRPLRVAVDRAAEGRRYGPGPILVVLVLVLGVAAAARLSRLGELPPVLSGDEANQILDGMDWLSGEWRTDPFGTGWYGTVRLGMLPAAVGALSSERPIAGPRLPYGLFGTLAVVAAAAAAWEVAGPWCAVGCAAFLALAPHHVHFSRLASVMVPDSLFAAAAVAFLLGAWRSGNPRSAACAGICAGLSLYGYAGGRVLPVVLLIVLGALPFLRRWDGRRRAWLGLALSAGLAVAGGPGLRFAVRNLTEWNSRFNQVSVFAEGWAAGEARRLGSPANVAASQLKAGTLGLLSAPDTTSWFTAHPIVGPPVLVAGAIAGAGWLLGRRKRLEALLVGLVVLGNFAGEVLTVAAPSPQRISSLVPMLAIFAGVALAGMISLIPESRGRRIGRAAAGTLAAGLIVATGIRDYPFDAGPFARYGGGPAAFVQSIAPLFERPRFRDRPVYLHGVPYVHSSFPSFRYFLPLTRFRDDDPEVALTERSFRSGIHVFPAERIFEAEMWRTRLKVTRAIRFGHPAYPEADVAEVFVVPGEE